MLNGEYGRKPHKRDPWDLLSQLIASFVNLVRE